MLFPHVGPERPALREGGPAVLAAVRVGLQVAQHVAVELVSLPEGLAAVDTSVGSLAGVVEAVAGHVGAQLEALAAVGAAVGRGRGVRLEVHVQGAALREALGAGGAGVGSLAGVRAQVLLEVLRGGEGAVAERAGAGAAALVRVREVAAEAGRRAELLAAEVAHAGPLARVDALVEQVGVARAQAAVAYRARVERLPVDLPPRQAQLGARLLVHAVPAHVPLAQVVELLHVARSGRAGLGATLLGLRGEF